MENVVRGIVLGGVTFKEKDKILSVFSLEKGLISCKLIGVLKENAKLKAVKEPFCFAELVLNSKNNNFYTISSANIIDSFFDITADYNKFVVGCSILEIIKKVAYEENPNEPLFIETLKALKTLAYEDVNPNAVLMKFLISIFEAMGYALSLEKCACCGEKFIGRRFFNVESGDIVCLSCKRPNSNEITPLVHSTLRLAKNTEYDNLKNLKLKKEGEVPALNLLIENFKERFECSLRFADKFPQ